VNYESQVLAKIDSLVPASETFFELCSNAEGVFPAVAFDVLKRLKAERSSARIQQLIDTADHQALDEASWFARLENLIVDFDWRFQKDTAERLFGMLSRFRSVVCIGAPTVFSLLSQDRRTDVLIDQNPYYERVLSTKGGTVFCSAIEDFDSFHLEKQFEAALLDPPWNLSDYKSWLGAAIPMVATGG
jgi:hypothetical protein